jgi:hypothetical protein
MRRLLDRLIDMAVRCLKCGAAGIGTCACWEECSCGWTTEAGTVCSNPATRRCSTKVKYGVYNRRTRRWEARPGRL